MALNGLIKRGFEGEALTPRKFFFIENAWRKDVQFFILESGDPDIRYWNYNREIILELYSTSRKLTFVMCVEGITVKNEKTFVYGVAVSNESKEYILNPGEEFEGIFDGKKYIFNRLNK